MRGLMTDLLFSDPEDMQRIAQRLLAARLGPAPLRVELPSLRSFSSLQEAPTSQEGVTPLPDMSAPALVSLFCSLTAQHAPNQEGVLGDLCLLAASLRPQMAALSYLELEAMVEALTLWPQAARYRHSKAAKKGGIRELVLDQLVVDGANDVALDQLFDMLKLECNTRLKSKLVSEDRFISLSSEHFTRVLPLSAAWSRIDSSTSPNALTNSFNNNYINDVGNADGSKNSNRRFKHFTKDSFVAFCGVMERTSLRKGFHKYYITVKFADLMDQMDEDDLGKVCRALVKKSIIHGGRHPMDVLVKTRLLDFLLEKGRLVQEQNLWHILVFLNQGGSPPAVHERLQLLQQLLVEDGRALQLPLHTLLMLMTASERDTHPPLLDLWLQRATACSERELSWDLGQGLRPQAMEAVREQEQIQVQRSLDDFTSHLIVFTPLSGGEAGGPAEGHPCRQGAAPSPRRPAGGRAAGAAQAVPAQCDRVAAVPGPGTPRQTGLPAAPCQVGLYPAELLDQLLTSPAVVSQVKASEETQNGSFSRSCNQEAFHGLVCSR